MMTIRDDFRMQNLEIITGITKTEKTEVYLVSGEKVLGNDVRFAVLKRYKNGISREHYLRIAEKRAPYFPVIYGIWQEGAEGFLLEEYISGKTLQKVLEEGKPLQATELTHYMAELCRALGVLHDMEPPIIHRDLKPENVMITAGGEVKLLDFDASREYKEKQERDTVYLGTREYASPEQFGFMQTDVRSDIYSWGIVFAELLEHASANTHYIRRARKIITRATMFDPERRYGNMQAVLSDLQKLEKNRGAAFIWGCGVVGLAAVVMLLAPDKEVPGGKTDLLQEPSSVAKVQLEESEVEVPEVTVEPQEIDEEETTSEPEILSLEEAYHYVSLEEELLRKKSYIMTQHSYLYNFQYDVSDKDGWYSETQETVIGRDYPTFRFLKAYPRDAILCSDELHGMNLKRISICRYDEARGENGEWMTLEEGDYTRDYDNIIGVTAEFMQNLEPGVYTVRMETGNEGIDSVGGFYLSVHGVEDKVDNFLLRVYTDIAYYSSAKGNDVVFYVNNSPMPITEIHLAESPVSRKEYDIIEGGYGVVFHPELLEKYKDLEGVDVQITMENGNRAVCRIINLDLF
ncbi:MAG: serine/threonine protein kinase [Lachnospiraceae bacterium]|nr:serine/threonine protein kinase [Lachnospiraceae bacterium]